MIARLLLALALLTTPCSGAADSITTIFMGSYRVTVPNGYALSNPDFPPVPVLEIGQQINRIDETGREDFSIRGAEGMRIDLHRLPILRSETEVPALLSEFIRIDSPLTPDRSTLRLVPDNIYWRAAVSGEVRKLNRLRTGETWWAISEDLEISVYFDHSVPSTSLCRGFAKEVVCVYRFLDEDTRWTALLALSGAETQMSDASAEALIARPELQVPLALLQSLEQTSAYRPCCLPLP